MSDREIDKQLVERAQGGDPGAFNLLVNKYQRKLVRFLCRFVHDPVEAEDIAQEAFMRAHRALLSFRGDSAFYTWLYRIGTNTAKNYLASQNRRIPTSTTFDASDAEIFDDAIYLHDIDTPEHLLATKQIEAMLSAVIDGLSDDLRSAIVLREIDGLSYAAIAVEMSCPLGTVRSRIFRAREMIAEKLQPHMEAEGGRMW